jgi:ABC-type uncharacterized transport system substrate-binding protein
VALKQASRTIPIVMAQAVDAVGGGFVRSMARPGGNVTGFIQFEYSLAAKWEAAHRRAYVYDPDEPDSQTRIAALYQGFWRPAGLSDVTCGSTFAGAV